MQRVLAQAKFMNPVFVQVCAEERLAGTSVKVWRKSVARRCTRSGQAVVLSKRLTGLLLHFDDGSRFFKGVASKAKVHKCHLLHYFELCWLTDTRLLFFFFEKNVRFPATGEVLSSWVPLRTHIAKRPVRSHVTH